MHIYVAVLSYRSWFENNTVIVRSPPFFLFNPTQSFDLVLQKSLRPQTKILIKGRAQQKLYYFYYNL